MKWLYVLFLVCFCTYAQEEDKVKLKALKASKTFTWEANKELAENDFVNAEANFRKAIAKSSENAIAPYNLGNAYYENETFSEAFTRYKEAGERATTKKDKHRAYHNMGNVFMKNKEYQKAVDAYKEALRNDPTDEETRYNLALAKEMLKKDQDENQNNDQNQDNEDQDDQQDQEEKNQGDNEKDGDQGDDEQEDGEKGDEGDDQQENNKEGEGDKEEEQQKQPNQSEQQGEQQEQKQPRPNQLSPQQAKNILEAMQNEERKVQEKLDAQKVKGVKVKNEKDW
ncbi:tetratricopeptide repeat protein [Arenibacter sp. GZD96]|uniref:tetratricopeptide repeat protein n=1 Tax=Aurantibrevibacter litoralis TaxID=3106030 RepID=UPI002AFF60C3|nr:tetratricopeptide repeat protein [Arenibacter sp. GZD-96]MEA1785693.1 tetratricopeptide repeat protein [Arenibacter sp. GZD-96]